MALNALTRQERRLVILLRWWTALFSIAAVGFVAFPDEIVRTLGSIGRTVFGWSGPPLEPSAERFWLVLAVSLMTVLILSAIKAQSDVIKNYMYVKVIIISKLASTLGFLVALLFSGHSFAYLAGAVVDGVIFLLTWFAYRKAIWSRYISK